MRKRKKLSADIRWARAQDRAASRYYKKRHGHSKTFHKLGLKFS